MLDFEFHLISNFVFMVTDIIFFFEILCFPPYLTFLCQDMEGTLFFAVCMLSST